MATEHVQASGATENDIRGVLIQVAGGRLLLPNATIAEVLSYAEPDAVAGAPDWLLVDPEMLLNPGVLLNEDAAFLPDLGTIEDQIGIALAQAQAA